MKNDCVFSRRFLLPVKQRSMEQFGHKRICLLRSSDCSIIHVCVHLPVCMGQSRWSFFHPWTLNVCTGRGRGKHGHMMHTSTSTSTNARANWTTSIGHRPLAIGLTASLASLALAYTCKEEPKIALPGPCLCMCVYLVR